MGLTLKVRMKRTQLYGTGIILFLLHAIFHILVLFHRLTLKFFPVEIYARKHMNIIKCLTFKKLRNLTKHVRLLSPLKQNKYIMFYD